jgi:predicted ATP-dependent protease
MLDEEIVQVVRENRFHIYAVLTVDEAMEILTGMKAGQILEDGNFESDSINARVDQKIREANEKLKKIAETSEEKKKPENNRNI